MTVSKNIGRGGKREGSGRKKKPTAPPLTHIPVTSGQGAQGLARRHVDLAIATLVHIATYGENEGARITAARSILEVAAGGKAKNQPDADEQSADDWGDLLDKQPVRRDN